MPKTHWAYQEYFTVALYKHTQYQNVLKCAISNFLYLFDIQPGQAQKCQNPPEVGNLEFQSLHIFCHYKAEFGLTI